MGGLVVGALLAACGAAAGDPSAGPAPSATPAAVTPSSPVSATADAGTSPPPADAGPGPECTGLVKIAGDFTWTIDFGGKKRTANVHVPLSYDPSKRTPLVLNIHGYTDTSEGQATLSKMIATADQEGFLVVHPQGVSNSWNAGGCCGSAMLDAVDDVGFLGKLLDEAEAKLCVDAKRVFAAGMSNGGFMAHRLACEMSERVAAVGSVAGLMTLGTCAPKRAVPVMQFHGTYDTVVPYAGNFSVGFPPVKTVIDDWAKRDGCTGAAVSTFDKDDVHCMTHATCKDAAEVTLCTVDGGGHTWPGGTPAPSFGWTTSTISATQALWTFFQKHPMP